MKTLVLSACPACGSAAFVDIDAGGGARLRRCITCATVSAAEYADPQEVFVDGYLSGDTNFGIDVTHPRFQAYLAGVNARRCAMLESIAGRRGALLDVGCGRGDFLAVARERGWRVQGVEPVADAARHARDARGLDVRTAVLQDAGLPEHAFDVVSAQHVLEHMPVAPDFLRMLTRWIRPGGHLLIEVPNFASTLRVRSGARWVHLRPLEHLVHFTPKTLEMTLERAGLRPIRLRSPSWIGPPQTLDQALVDLARPEWRRWLAPLCPERPVGDAHVRVPSRAVWGALRAADRLYDARGIGAVVVAVGGVPA